MKKDALKKVCEEQAEKAGPSPAKKDSEKKQKSQRVKIRNLTDAVLVQLSSYYQKEARPFWFCSENEENNIVTFYHRSFTDVIPQHQYCPEGGDS